MKKYILMSILLCCNYMSAAQYYSYNSAYHPAYDVNSNRYKFYNLLNIGAFSEALDIINLFQGQEKFEAQNNFLWTVRLHKNRLVLKYIDILEKFADVCFERILELTPEEQRLVVLKKKREIIKANSVIKTLASLKNIKPKSNRFNFSITTPQINIAFDVDSGMQTNIVVDSSDEEEISNIKINTKKRPIDVIYIDSDEEYEPAAKKAKKN